MECKNDVHKTKNIDKKNIKRKIAILWEENSNLKKKLKNKDAYKVKYKSKDTSKDINEIKCKDKNIRSNRKTPQDVDSDSVEESENENINEIKHKGKSIWNRIKTLQNEDSDSMEESENENTNEIKCKVKNIGTNRKTSQDEDSDSTEESENENTNEIKCKDKNIENNKKTSQDVDSDSMEESENENTNEIKHKGKNIWNRMKTLQNEDSDSMEESENENKCQDENIENNRKTSQHVDSDPAEESENENTNEIKCKGEDIRNKIKTLQNKDSDLKSELKNDTHKVKSDPAIPRRDLCVESGNIALTNKNTDAKKMLKNKFTRKAESDDDESDEGVEEEYCSDATYLARQIASAERLCQAESTQLYNLRVQLKHIVPPQHEIETRAGSHIPTRKEVEEFEKIIPIKRGSFSVEEDKIIARNWKAFCKLHNWDIKKIKPFLQLRIGTLTYMRNAIERKKFVQFLADGLPDRTLYSIYHRFRNLYEDNLQRRYKPEEDEMIINHLEHNPSLDEKRKYADLAKVLRRTRNSIWRRYRILKRNKKRKNDD